MAAIDDGGRYRTGREAVIAAQDDQQDVRLVWGTRGLEEALADFGVRLEGAAALGLGDVEETEKTFEGNAALKSEAACAASGRPAMADDSGLCVDALGGDPGIYSARWAGEPRDFAKAMRRVHEALDSAGAGDRTARFVSVLALTRPGQETVFYRGEVEGEIVWPPRGDGGFGYDPVFVPKGESRTFGEMSPAEKKMHSHRARAVASLIKAEFGDEA